MASNTYHTLHPFALGLACIALLSACQNEDDIIRAARFDDLNKLRDCVEAGIPVDHADPAGETALFHIVGMGSDEGFQLLLDHGADVRLRDGSGNTLLHKAITFEQNSLALKLIDRGVDVSATNKVGATALHYAVRAGNQAMVELLLSKGADIEVKDSAGSTPVEIAHAMSGRQNLSDTMGRKISSKQMNKIMSALTKLTTNK